MPVPNCTRRMRFVTRSAARRSADGGCHRSVRRPAARLLGYGLALAGTLVGTLRGGTAAAQTTGATPPAAGDTIVRPTGTLRSGDLLRVRVYRDSELSGQFLIDAQGNVQIPGLGVIRAAGLDPTEVQERLVEALRSRGFRAPEIAVQPQIRVSVLGRYAPRGCTRSILASVSSSC